MKPVRMPLARRLLALMLVGAAVMTARAEQGPRDLFERARLAEENVRTLGRALELYRQAAAEAGTDRPLASEAELRAALVLERQGMPEAREALAAVARTYGDLPAGRAASARLAEESTQAPGLIPRLIRNDINFPRAFSFDGQRALMLVPDTPSRFPSPGSLAVQNVATGELTVPVQTVRTADGTRLDAWPENPVFSPDGRQVVYEWHTTGRAAPGGQASASLRVIAAQPGAQPRTLIGPTPRPPFDVPFAWSSDGQSILVKRQQPGAGPQLLRVSVANGEIQHLASFEQYQGFAEPGIDVSGIDGLKLSPDGQTLAYSVSDRPGSQDRYIYTLNTVTREQRPVVTMAGVNVRPTWSPDGSQLFFVNEQSGRRALWVVGVRGGTADGDPRLVLADFQGSPIDMSVTGDLYSVRQQYAGFVESVAERNPAGSPIIQTFLGQSGIWSRGNKLAFIRRGGGDVADMIVRDMSTGEERTYRRPGGFAAQSPSWLPDDSGLIVSLNANVDPEGPAFYRLDLASGNLVRLFAKDTADHRRSAGSLVSADGRSLYMLVGSRVPFDPPTPGFATRMLWTGMVAIDLATGAERPLMTFPGGGFLAGTVGMALSPDGQTLALNHVHPAQWRLITVGIDGSNWREIHTDNRLARLDAVRWTPDGQSLLFIEGSGTWRMMRIPATGGTAVFDGLDSANFAGTVPLPTYEVANIANFDVSPDGRRVVFGSRTVPTYDVTVLENLLAYLMR